VHVAVVGVDAFEAEARLGRRTLDDEVEGGGLAAVPPGPTPSWSWRPPRAAWDRPPAPRRAPGATPLTVADLGRRVWLLREPGSGTRSTTEELFDALGIVPPTLTLGSNGAIRESVQVGLGITLISRDAVARELEQGELEEWAVPGGPHERSWHVVGRTDEELPATARLFLAHLAAPDRARRTAARAPRPGDPGRGARREV